MINILMQKEFSPEQISYLEGKYGIKIFLMKDDKFPEKDILDGIEIFTGWRTEKAMEALPHLKWIHLYSAGVDRYAKKFGQMENPPRLTNSRGAYSVPLGEHALALLLGVIRKINRYAINQTERNWHYEGRVKEICGSTAGIVGFGDVGRYNARLMKAMGAAVLAHKLHESEKPDYVDEMYFGNEGLREMLSKCDFVIVSLPGTEETRHLFDKKMMLKMKQGAVIINVGRGYVINCDDLSELIESGHLGGAGLDVTDPEPLNPEHRLWGLENVIITPHMAWSSPNGKARMLGVFEENLKSWLAGEKMPNEIDYSRGY